MPGSTAYGCQRYDILFSGSIRSIAISMVTGPWSGRVIWPWTRPPGAKTPSSFMPNQAPNSSALARARQTRERGARRTISFSIRSVVLCNLMVASYRGRPTKCNPKVAYPLPAADAEACRNRRRPFDEWVRASLARVHDDAEVVIRGDRDACADNGQ